MHVEQLELREQWLAEQLTERADDAELGLRLANPRQRLRLLAGRGLQGLDPERIRGRRHRRRAQPPSAASATVRRRDDEDGTVL